jgi:RNA polymerase sigma factor (TIGR02999 family)
MIVDRDASAASDPQHITALLHSWTSGNKSALDELMPLVYAQLRKLAYGCLASEGRKPMLQATTLVHEAYLRLVQVQTTLHDRVHFYALAARVLRHILVDHAKAAKRGKRGGDAIRVTWDEALFRNSGPAPAILDLDSALQALAAQDARKSEILEMIFFGGMTYDEVAAALNISPATVHRELALAKAWVRRELERS